MVKTIWQIDKPVSIDSFFVSPHITVKDAREKVLGFDSFGQKSVLVEGIAGQGKSILLRWLCVQELKGGIRIPIFFELRRLKSGQSLYQGIQQTFKYYGLDVDQELFKLLCASGKVLLILDGFDEVDEQNKSNIVHDIEDLILVNDGISLIVSSRPNSELQSSPHLHVVRLSDLKHKEYEEIIQKISDSNEYAENLKSAIRSSRNQLSQLLCTPLMVTLLVMQFKAYQEVPKYLSEFYSSIFQILISRHDGVKAGFRRGKKCKISDAEYRTVFEAACFFSKKKKSLTFERADFVAYIKQALLEYRIEEAAEGFLDDIVGVTNLILRESEEYRFIHKSVQEYYGAAFIKSRPEAVVRSFYEKIRGSAGEARVWEQEMRFLSEIDRYAFLKHYFIPVFEGFLGVSSEGKIATEADSIMQGEFGKLYLFGSVEGGARIYLHNASLYTMLPIVNDYCDIYKISGAHLHEAVSKIIEKKLNGIAKDVASQVVFDGSLFRTKEYQGDILFTYQYLYEEGILDKQALADIQKLYEDAVRAYRRAIEDVRRLEDERVIGSVIDLIG